MSVFGSFMTSEAMKTIQTAKHATSDEYQADMPVDINMLGSRPCMNIRVKVRYLSLFRLMLNNKIKSEQPIIFDLQ